MLSQRDQDIIDHIATYRVTVPEILGPLLFADVGRTAMTKVLGRLVKTGHLEKRDIYPPRKYWTLSRRTAQSLGLSPDFPNIGPQAFADAYSTLYFCCQPEAEVQRYYITHQQLQADRPELAVKGMTSRYYFLEKQQDFTRLGFLIVDQGADYFRILRKGRAATQKRYVVPAFKALIDEGRFVIGIATSNPEKRLRMTKAIDDLEFRVSVPYVIEVIPDLVNLIPRKEKQRIATKR